MGPPDSSRPKYHVDVKNQHQGVVKNYHASHGIGIITLTGGKQDVTVHQANITNQRGLQAGQHVGFQLVKGPKGFEAKALTIYAALAILVADKGYRRF
ncbi:hypothetical protein CI109_100843 [Kwoniella shandongensis]|uniref:CSD domain-containing protein n=1 Tax=Kwoniella shandongensis TaxID=1734106 RepID=A0AAJ8LER1_9TREE